MSGRNDQTPATRILTSPPGALRAHNARTRMRLSRARIMTHYRRRRTSGAAADGEEGPSVSRTLRFEDDTLDQLPSTSTSRPIASTSRSIAPDDKVLLDYKRQLHQPGSSGSGSKSGYAQQDSDSAIANRLLFKARASFCLDERALLCLNCGKLPLMPVTGSCGHTRCLGCIQNDLNCPCGISHTPWLLSVNVMVQEVIQKIMSTDADLRQWMSTINDEVGNQGPQDAPSAPAPPGCNPPFENENRFIEEQVAVPLKKKQEVKCDNVYNEPDATKPVKSDSTPNEDVPARDNAGKEEGAPNAADNPARPIVEEGDNELYREPITPQVRLNYASHLIQTGKLLEAGLHLARLASCASDVAQCAHQMLLKVISELSNTVDVSEIEKLMSDAIGAQATTEWLGARDLECVFCCDTLTNPVTTPCGHTFCRQCLERSLDYRTTCALCMQVLNNFNLQEVCITESVRVALEGIGAVKPPEPRDPNLIPILACTVTFPGMPCPLFLFEPRYRHMVRRILESESRRFGLVAHERQSGMFSDYGTILELRECVHLRNGCTIVSTIGISRFRVVERDIFDGWCDVARVNPVADIPIVCNETVAGLRVLARHISFKVALWLSCFSNEMRNKIQRTFGAMPYIDAEGDWWKTPDGPVWLWWIISTLPLTMEIKVLVLATDCLVKRMRAVLRTLDNSLAQTRQSLFEYELALTEWWEQRHL